MPFKCNSSFEAKVFGRGSADLLWKLVGLIILEIIIIIIVIIIIIIIIHNKNNNT